jgi:RHS repeat-associated protein
MLLFAFIALGAFAQDAPKFRGAAVETGLPSRYRVTVVLQPGEDLEAVGSQLAATYGARLEPYAEDGFTGFAIMATDRRARLLSADPRVTLVEEMAEPLAQEEPVALQRPPVTIASDAIRGFGTYAYDGSGNITSAGDGTGADTFVYDRLGRLEGATLRGEPCSNMPATPCRTEKYTYDRFGNIVSIATAGNPSNTVFTNADDDTNRITGAGVVYDSRGNLTAYQSRQFTYDGLDMMTSSDMDGIRRIYVYSATDERVVTVGKVGSTFTGSDWTIRDAGGRVLRRLARSASGTFTWTEDSVYRGGLLLSAAVPGPEKVRNFHLDHLGTPRLITGNGGAQIAEHHYRPYGPETPSSTWDDEKAKFTGHERDTATLDYMHARYYDPYLGRFLSVDPGKDWDLQQPQSWNLYTYVRSNPVNRFDPTGRCGEKSSFIGPREACDPEGNKPKRKPRTAEPEPEGGPPVPVPGAPDVGWKYNPNPNNGRKGNYGPKKPIKTKTGSQPSASWENDAPVPHWDVDNGLGERKRYDKFGNYVTPGEAHGTPTKRTTTVGPLGFGEVLGGLGLAILGTAVMFMTGGSSALVQPATGGVAIVPRTPDVNGMDKDCPGCT